MPNMDDNVTRIMRVTMPRTEFLKYDSGITHSDHGIRTAQGRLSTLPDIRPISDHDIRRGYINSTPSPQFGIKQAVAGAAFSIGTTLLVEAILSPEVRHWIAGKFKRRKKYDRNCYEIVAIYEELDGCLVDGRPITLYCKLSRFYPDKYEIVEEREMQGEQCLIVKKKNQQIKTPRTETSDLTATHHSKELLSYEIETVDSNNRRMVVTGEEARQIIDELKRKTSELTKLIYWLQNIYIKDDNTDEEFVIAEETIKTLASQEATATMKMLMNNRHLIDKDSAICFDDWLHGYIRNSDHIVPISSIYNKTRRYNE